MSEHFFRDGGTLGLLAVVRNAAAYLREWLTHYRLEGVSQCILIDNNSSDTTAAIGWLQGCTVAPVRNAVLTVHVQNALYRREAARRVRTEWLLIADADEFVYARCGYRGITDYLRTRPRNVGSVMLPWKLMGGCESFPPTSLVHDCRRSAAPDWSHRTLKTILRMGAVDAWQNQPAPVHYVVLPRKRWLTVRPTQAVEVVRRARSGAEAMRLAPNATSVAATGLSPFLYYGQVPDPAHCLQINHYFLRLPRPEWLRAWESRLRLGNGWQMGYFADDQLNESGAQLYDDWLLRSSAMRDEELHCKRSGVCEKGDRGERGDYY